MFLFKVAMYIFYRFQHDFNAQKRFIKISTTCYIFIKLNVIDDTIYTVYSLKYNLKNHEFDEIKLLLRYPIKAP